MSESKKSVLIGVGGSGQHVLHAYLQLLALSDAPISKIPHVYIIDADAKESADHPKDSPLTASIRHLHKSLVSPLKDDLEPECRLIRPYFQEQNEVPSKAAISLGVVDTSQPLAHALLMNEEDAEFNDREVKIGAGMMANARIGSSVFGVKWEDCQAEKSRLDTKKLQNNFGQLFHNVAGARVVIVGSTFGGTGSGVIPALVRLLEGKEDAPKAVRAFMTLPWFDIAPSSIDDKSAARKQGDISPMTRNASLGLRTYISELEGNKHSDYVVAQFLGEKPARKDNGNFNQHENAHVFNLMLAAAVQQFFERPLAATAGKLLALVAKGEEQKGIVNAATSAHLRLYTDDNYRTLQELMVNTEFVALALEKGAEYITSNFRVEGADDRPEPDGLRLFVNSVFEKMGGTLTETTGFFGFGEKKKRSNPEAYKELAKNMKAVANRLRFSLCWLDKHKTTAQDKTGLKTIDDVRHLFNGNLESDPLGYEVLRDSPANENQLKDRWPKGGLDDKDYKNKQTNATITGAAKVSQAFTLFTNVFFTENKKSLDHSAALEAQFKAETDIENKYYVAAQFLAKMIYQEVTLARKHLQPTATNEEQSCLMLKGFDDAIDSSSITGFDTLKVLSVSSLQIGDLTSQEHPLTIRHLDPYVGIDKISQLLKQGLSIQPEKIFPETALKGIPNILAPMLLQEWRLNQWNDNTDKQALENSSGKLISTRYGIYLHARRIVEAAFWLIFTQDKRIALVENKDTPQNSKFQKLLNSEFSRQKPKRQSPTLWIELAEGKHKGQPVFIYDAVAGWYLAANTAARQFFAEIMPELPTVKYGDGLLEALWRNESYAQATSLERQSYDAYVIAAFIRYLTNNIKIIEKIVEQTQTKPLWLQAIKDISEQLLPKVKDELAESTQRLSNKSTGKKLSLIGADDALEIQEIAELSAFNDLFVDNPVYFGSKVRVWPLKGMAWQHIEPYTKEESAKEAKAFTVSETKKSDGNGSRSEWRWDEIRFKLKVKDKNLRKVSLGEISYKNHPKLKRIAGIDHDDNLAWSTAIWPNFEARKWTYYLVGGDSGAVAENELQNIDLKGTSLRGECLEFVFWGELYTATGLPAKIDEQTKKLVAKDVNEQPDFGKLGVVKNNAPIKLNGVPRCVEICFGGVVLGSIPVQLECKLASDTPNRCSVALDFGTSNTCMAISVTTDNEPDKPKVSTLPLFEGEIFESTPLSLGLTWAAGSLISSGKYNHQKLPTLFFQSFNQPPQVNKDGKIDNKPRSVPSELLFVSGVANRDVKKNIKLDSDRGYLGRIEIKEKYKSYALLESFGSVNHCCLEGGRPVVVPLWTPFPPMIDETLRRELISSSTDEGDRVENFKWPMLDVHFAYRAAYLESIIVASFATLRINGYSNIQKLIATYPGAFEKTHKEGYFRDLRDIVEKLRKQCGIELREISERSETIAGLVGSHRTHREVSLTIDMGGGTTDIGFVIPKVIDNGRSDEKPDAYMSSLRYAGTHLLEAIVGQSFAANGMEKTNAQKRIDLLNMKLKIREGVSSLTFGEEANNRYKLVTEAFFRGLFEYVFNMVSAFANTNQSKFPSTGDINIYFLGNGCNLVDVFCKSTVQVFFETVCKEAVAIGLLTESVRERFRYPLLDETDKKQMLIKGALQENGDTSPEGKQYKYIETQGHGGRAIWLPCIKDDSRPSQQVTLGALDSNDGDPVLCGAEDENLKSSFGLTHKYWQAVELDTRKLVSLVPANEYKDFGKYYLEKKFVTEVLCKLTKEPVVEKTKSKPATSTSASSSQQSGFKPSAVSESIATPPASNVPPSQNQNNFASDVTLSSGANTLIDGNNITVNLSWQSPFELDVIAFALNDKGKVTADENTIFYNQPNYAQGAVLLNVAQRQLNIVLSKIPSHIKTIAICAVTGIDDESAKGKNFGQVSHSAINVLASNKIIFELNHVKGTETAMIFGEVYRHNNTWKFRAKGQGYAGGFKKMCDEYGAEY